MRQYARFTNDGVILCGLASIKVLKGHWSMSSDWVDLFPIVFLPLKIIAIGIAGFFAVKWHHDQDKAKKSKDEGRGL